MAALSIISNELGELAADFVNSTSRNIFLTGKAGTGKTTFLHNLAKSTHKPHIIVAPTGIAALNAGGVTIHSQFLLPFGAFNPGAEPDGTGKFYDAQTLVRRHPLNSQRKQVLRDLELLIIDEVSMLRADLLDAIDHRLRSARRNQKPFGGVQLLLIGDLFQLPPIVNDQEWTFLRKYYSSIHFFSSLALQKEGYVYIELEKVYRQVDGTFINLLNNLRNNCCTTDDIALLNEHYRSDTDRIKDAVTLTTHNYQADGINQKALDELKTEKHKYEAIVKGDFPEHLYPLSPTLELKVGAQVMFVKNDPEGKFYNGKLGIVQKLKEDGITVKGTDDGLDISLERRVWENKKYSIDEQKEINEDVVGTFEHYPIKLAWAITVHKSQGLTFDKAVIDVGQAFAPGQVYVALSRLRSLDGLVLRTKINPGVISSDLSVVSFGKRRPQKEELGNMLKAGRAVYLQEALHRTFNFRDIVDQYAFVERKVSAKMEFTDADMRNALPLLREKLNTETTNTARFRNQISLLLQEADYDKLKERVDKGSTYYLDLLFEMLYQNLLHLTEASTFAKTKTYVSALEEVDQMIMKKIADLQKARRLTLAILEGGKLTNGEEERRKRVAKRDAFLMKIEGHIKQNPRKGAGKTGKKRKKQGSPEKGATYEETYRMLGEGLNAEQIAVKRSLALGTIESHIARGISAGKVKIEKFMPQLEVDEIVKAFGDSADSLSEVYASFKGRHSYGKLRMVQAHLKFSEATAE